MTSQPLVSVVMPVWNDARWLGEAIDSILGQTLHELELIVVDDGSTDETPAILEAYAARESRVRVLRVTHGGTARALNHGLDASTAEFVANLDSDDWSHPDRLSLQVRFLRDHPELVMVGCDVDKIDEHGCITGAAARPPTDAAIRFKTLLWAPFTQSATTARRQHLVAHGLRYDESLRGSEDYEFWTRLLDTGRCANLPERLVRYRVRQGMSTRHRSEFVTIAVSIARRTIERWIPGFETDEKEVRALRSAFGGMGRVSISDDAEGHGLARRYLELFEAFALAHAGDPDVEALARFEASRFLSAFRPRLDDAGWLELVARLHRLDPGFPRRYLARWAPRLRREALRDTGRALLDGPRRWQRRRKTPQGQPPDTGSRS